MCRSNGEPRSEQADGVTTQWNHRSHDVGHRQIGSFLVREAPGTAPEREVDEDIPLPLWAYFMLAGLLGIVSRKRLKA